MKKAISRSTIQWAIIVTVFVIGIAVLIVNVDVKFARTNKDQELTTYILPPDVAKNFVGTTPKEFVEIEKPLSGISSNLYTSAKVNEDGYLVLVLNKEQKQDWKDFCLEQIEYAEKNDSIISPDYTEITLLWNGSSESSIASMFALIECYAMQVINGVGPSELQVKYVIVDANTEEVLFEAIYPNDDINYHIENGQIILAD